MGRVLRSEVLCLLAALGLGIPATAAADTPPQQLSYGVNDLPGHFEDPFPDQDFTRRVEMIPMRDGMKKSGRGQ